MRSTAWQTAVVLVVMLAAGPALGGGVVAADTPVPHQNGTHEPDTVVDCTYPIEVTDGTSETVTVEEEPEDVVVLGANVAQQLWAMDAQAKVVGMPIFSGSAYLDNRTEYAQDIADDIGFPVHEEVVALEPDLVLAPSIITPEDVSALRELGLTVYSAPTEESLADVYADIERTGQLVGEYEAAAAVLGEMRGTVEAIEAATAEESPVSVLYWQGGGWTAGNNTVENDLITHAGGENIAAGEIDGYGELSEEIIVDSDPEFLVLHEGVPIPDEVSGTTAVEENQVVRVSPDFLSQVGPRMTEPLGAMAQAFHPDAYDETAIESADPVPVGQCESTAGAGDADGATTSDADGDGAGLTVVAAALALASVALLARRRV